MAQVHYRVGYVTLLGMVLLTVGCSAEQFYGETFTTATTVGGLAASSTDLYAVYGGNTVASTALSGSGAWTTLNTGLSSPTGVVHLPTAGVLLIGEFKGIQQYTLGSGITTKVAGGAAANSLDGIGSAARMNEPHGLIVTADESVVYFVDAVRCELRSMTYPGFAVVTHAGGTCGFGDATGTSAKFNAPTALAFGASEASLIIADGGNNRLRSATIPGYVVTTLACSGTAGSADGAALSATCNNPSGVVRMSSSGIIYFIDQGTSILRRLSAGTVTTVLGTANTPGMANGYGAAGRLNVPLSIAVDATGYLYIGQSGSSARVVRVTISADTTTTTTTTTTAATSTTTTTTAAPSTSITSTTSSSPPSTTSTMVPATTVTPSATTLTTTTSTPSTTMAPPSTGTPTLAPSTSTTAPTDVATTTSTTAETTVAPSTPSSAPSTSTPVSPTDTTSVVATSIPVSTDVEKTLSPSSEGPSTTTPTEPLTTTGSTSTPATFPTGAPSTLPTKSPSVITTGAPVDTTAPVRSTLEPLPPPATDPSGSDTTPAVTGSLALKINVETARARASELRSAIADAAQVTVEAVTILAILPGSAVVQFEIKTKRDPATVADGMSTSIQSGGALASFAPVIETLTLQRKPGDALFAVGVAFYSCVGLAIIGLGASIGWSLYRRRHPDPVMKTKPTAELRSGTIYVDVQADTCEENAEDGDEEKVELLRIGPKGDSKKGIRVIKNKNAEDRVKGADGYVIDLDGQIGPQSSLSDEEEVPNVAKQSPRSQNGGPAHIVNGPGFRRNPSRRRFQGFSAAMLPDVPPSAPTAQPRLSTFDMLQRLQPSREVVDGDLAAGYAMK